MRDLSQSEITTLRNILTGLSPASVKTARSIWRQAMGDTQTEIGTAFTVGDRVTFRAKGQVYTGTVSSVNHRTLSIDATSAFGTPGKWRVAPSFCTKIG